MPNNVDRPKKPESDLGTLNDVATIPGSPVAENLTSAPVLPVQVTRPAAAHVVIPQGAAPAALAQSVVTAPGVVASPVSPFESPLDSEPVAAVAPAPRNSAPAPPPPVAPSETADLANINMDDFGLSTIAPTKTHTPAELPPPAHLPLTQPSPVQLPQVHPALAQQPATDQPATRVPASALPASVAPPWRPQQTQIASLKTTQSVRAPAPQPFSPVRFVRKYFLYLALSGLISAAMGWYASGEFESESYNFTSQLLYSRFGSEGLGYVSPSLTALTPLTSSRRVLGQAITDLEMELDVEELEMEVEVEVPYESSLFTIGLHWPTEAEGTQVLDSIVDVFIRVVVETRRESIDQTMTGIRNNIRKIESNIASYRESLQDFNNRHGVLNLDNELNALTVEIDLLEDRLSQSTHRLEGNRAKLAALTAKDTESAGESGARNAQQSMRMEEYKVTKDLLSDEEQRIRQKADLDFHEKQFAIDQEMYKSQLITKTEYEASRHKLETLKAMYHPSLKTMRSQVDTAEREIKQMLRSGDTTTILANSGSALKATVEMSIISGEVEAKRLAEQLEAKEQRLKDLASNRIEGQSLNAELKTLASERERLQRRAIYMKNIYDNEPI